jgi:lysosomal acid lipase/cholesteryl ester hydrolase
LNDKVDVFVALAPAMSPPGLNSRVVNSLVKASPDFIFLAFGRRAILSSATMWEALLYPPIFVRVVDMANKFLFGWQSENITPHQKLAAFPKLYSFTSTKSVVHWFQIIRNGKFQMYDDEMQGLGLSDTARYYKVAKFPTRNIKTPIVLLYGGSDSLVDIKVMLKELPKHTLAREIPHYEHLDFLWASDVHQQVFPHVFEALEKYTGGGGQDESMLIAAGSSAPTLVEASGNKDMHDATTPTDDDFVPRKHSQSVDARQSKRPSSRVRNPRFSSPALSASNAATDRTSTSRPEGWWSSDEVAGTEPSTPAKRSSSLDASHVDSRPKSPILALGHKGISIGAAKAVGGIGLEGIEAVQAHATGPSDSGASLKGVSEARKRKRKKKEDL